MPERYYEPARHGQWDNLPMPTTVEELTQRVAVLEAALGFYSNAQSYGLDADGPPSNWDLVVDAGLRARLGRTSGTMDDFLNRLQALL
jgi:hypothetical protein